MFRKIPFLDLRAINEPYAAAFQAKLQEILQRGWFLRGEETRHFEQSFATYCGASHCVGVANGLDALSLTLLALKHQRGWSEGDEVLLPAHTFIATAQAVIRAGFRPVLVDISSNDYLIDTRLIETFIGSRTRAILPVHLYGMPCFMEPILELAHRYDLFVLEDAAQAHGSKVELAGQTLTVGNIGGATAFSFYPGKNLGALGDGGCVTTNDEELADTIRTLANYGAKEKYKHQILGTNSRLDELQAAFLRLKLQNLDTDNRRRQEIAERYMQEIRHPSITLPYQGIWQEAKKSVFHIFPIFSAAREKLQDKLAQCGIDTLIHYPLPLHRQAGLLPYLFQLEAFPSAEEVCATELSLPISPIMTEQEVEYVIECVNTISL